MTDYERAALAWYVDTGHMLWPDETLAERASQAVRVLEFERRQLEYELGRMPPKPT